MNGIFRVMNGIQPCRFCWQTSDIKCDWYRFKPTLHEDMARSDMIISHAGAGSVMEALGEAHPSMARGTRREDALVHPQYVSPLCWTYVGPVYLHSLSIELSLCHSFPSTFHSMRPTREHKSILSIVYTTFVMQVWARHS